MAAIALALFASIALAEDNYPSHPVRVIAASAAGGNPDVLARILSARLTEIFNNPFVVEDVPGVGGVIAAKNAPYLVFRTPDGAWHSVVSVTIPERSYLRESLQRMTPTIERQIRLALKRAAKKSGLAT